jgi:hypothetical protein
MWLALLLAHAQAECPPAALAEAMQHVGEMKSAYTANDSDAFDVAATALLGTLPCIDDPVSPKMAVELHHIMGLRAFANQDDMGAQRSLSAVRELAPEWRPNEGTLEKDSALYRFYEMQLPTESIPLAAHPPGGWLIDGTPGDAIPGHRAFVLQALGKDGEVVFSGYFSSPSTLPVFDFPTGQARRNIRVGGSIGAGALLAGALVIEIASATARSRADDPALSGAEKLARLERSDTLRTVGIGLAIGGGVGGGLTWVIPW